MVRRSTRERKATGLDYTQLNWMHVQQLLHGTPWDENWGFKDVDELVATWKAHRRRLVELFSQQRHPWEYRPFAEWLVEIIPAHGERIVTDYYRTHIRERRPSLLRWGILHTHTTPAIQEPEEAYLRRHGIDLTES